MRIFSDRRYRRSPHFCRPRAGSCAGSGRWSLCSGMVINHLGETTNVAVRHINVLAGYASQTADQYIFGIGGDRDGQSALARAKRIGLKMALI